MEIISANDRHEEILSLMNEYVDWLMENDDKMKEVLVNQHLDDEIADFNSKYAPPEGRLYLALVDEQPAGCIALTKWEADETQDNVGFQHKTETQDNVGFQHKTETQDNVGFQHKTETQDNGGFQQKAETQEKMDCTDCATSSDTADPVTYCEVKRLYVRPEFRGHKIGQKIIELIIADAREIGYTYMRLDSFPFMASAVKLYEQYGFYPIENYCGNPSENALFYELKL